MRSNLLQHNAPGETRTPNLLIRSQSGIIRSTHGTVLRLWSDTPEADVQIPKTDDKSHNNSHNTAGGIA